MGRTAGARIGIASYAARARTRARPHGAESCTATSAPGTHAPSARTGRARAWTRYRSRMSWPVPSPIAAFQARRARLAQALGGAPALVVAGLPRARNYAANTYAFRAESHFLYLVGRHLPGAALLVAEGGATLYAPPPDADDALWHGPSPTLAELSRELGVDVVDVAALPARLATLTQVATLPAQDDPTAAWQSALLGREVTARSGARLAAASPDARLADAMIAQRLVHDDAAIAQHRQAAAATTAAHLAGLGATRAGLREAHVRAAMEGALASAGMDTSYRSIVTVHGEVLHHDASTHELRDGDSRSATSARRRPRAGRVT